MNVYNKAKIVLTLLNTFIVIIDKMCDIKTINKYKILMYKLRWKYYMNPISILKYEKFE